MSVGLQQVFNTMTSAMSAQSIRMNIIASNLANAESVGSTEADTYRTKHPVFQEIKNSIPGINAADQPVGGVRVSAIIESTTPLEFHIDKGHPLADESGQVFSSDVNPIQEMTDMVSASREYQADVEVMNTIKSLVIQSIHAMKE